MLGGVALGYALVFIVVMLMIYAYIESALWQIFKEVKLEEKLLGPINKIIYLNNNREKLPKHVQGKVDEIFVCLAIMTGLLTLSIILYLFSFL